jgi:hypothetical protein
MGSARAAKVIRSEMMSGRTPRASTSTLHTTQHNVPQSEREARKRCAVRCASGRVFNPWLLTLSVQRDKHTNVATLAILRQLGQPEQTSLAAQLLGQLRHLLAFVLMQLHQILLLGVVGHLRRA